MVMLGSICVLCGYWMCFGYRTVYMVHTSVCTRREALTKIGTETESGKRRRRETLPVQVCLLPQVNGTASYNLSDDFNTSRADPSSFLG